METLEKLTVALSSRALFNLDKSHAVFENEGVKTYYDYQVEREESPLSADQVVIPQEDGKLRIIAAVTDTPQLLWWLLSLGDGVEVVRPKALRQSIAETAGRMCANYQG